MDLSTFTDAELSALLGRANTALNNFKKAHEHIERAEEMAEGVRDAAWGEQTRRLDLKTVSAA